MNMKRFLLSILCCLVGVIAGHAAVNTIEDVLNRTQTGITGTSYKSWSGITLNSGAVYAGQSAGGNSSIQLRSSNSNSGIITTQSGGKVRKVTVEWHSETANGRTLDIYGKKTAYSSPTDLYKTANQGTKLGSITYGTSTVLTIDGDYEYIGLRSNNNAMYLTSITITWEQEVADEENQKPMMPSLPQEGKFVGFKTIEISCETEGAEIYYTIDGNEPTTNSTLYADPFEITQETTVKAIAVNEFGSSNVVSATYTRVAANPTIAFEGDATFEEQVTANLSVENGHTAYYTLDGTTPTDKSTEYTQPLIIKATATLQVIAYDKDGYKSDVVEQAFTHKSDAATLVTSVADIAVGDQVVIVASGYNYALSTTQNENNRGSVAVTKDGDNVILTDDIQILTLEKGKESGQFAFQTGAGYLYAASTTKNYLRTGSTLDNKASFTIEIANTGVATIKADQNDRNWLRFNNLNNPKIFSCYGSGQENVSLYKVNIATVEDHVLTVSAAGWATLFLGYNAVIPTGVKCYKISEIGDGTVALEQVTTGVLPANTGVIVEATAGEYTFEVTDATADVESNLSGSVNNEYVDKDAYVLSIVDGEVGLYKAQMAGGVFLNNANKAYLPASAVSGVAQGASGFKFRFDNQTTGIEGAPALNGTKAIYDLSGRKVNDITAPGLYIVNGKKVMVK